MFKPRTVEEDESRVQHLLRHRDLDGLRLLYIHWLGSANSLGTDKPFAERVHRAIVRLETENQNLSNLDVNNESS